MGVSHQSTLSYVWPWPHNSTFKLLAGFISRDDKAVNPVQAEGHVWASIRLFRHTLDLISWSAHVVGQKLSDTSFFPLARSHCRMMGAVNMVSNQRGRRR